MSNTKKPTDAREAEATNRPGTFEFRGETFTVSRNRDEWTLDFLESVEEGKSVGIVRGALGPDQWRAVKAMGLLVKDVDELADLLAQAMGFADTGE